MGTIQPDNFALALSLSETAILGFLRCKAALHLAASSSSIALFAHRETVEASRFRLACDFSLRIQAPSHNQARDIAATLPSLSVCL
jgi:hypothetical protein